MHVVSGPWYSPPMTQDHTTPDALPDRVEHNPRQPPRYTAEISHAEIFHAPRLGVRGGADYFVPERADAVFVGCPGTKWWLLDRLTLSGPRVVDGFAVGQVQRHRFRASDLDRLPTWVVNLVDDLRGRLA